MLVTIKHSTWHGSLPTGSVNFSPRAPSMPKRACILFRLASSLSYTANHAHIYPFSHLACSVFPYLNLTIYQRLAQVQSALQCSLRDPSPSPWTRGTQSELLRAGPCCLCLCTALLSKTMSHLIERKLSYIILYPL